MAASTCAVSTLRSADRMITNTNPVAVQTAGPRTAATAVVRAPRPAAGTPRPPRGAPARRRAPARGPAPAGRPRARAAEPGRGEPVQPDPLGPAVEAAAG